MADGVAISAGVGTDIATDQLAGGAHVQYVKILDGTPDSSAYGVVSTAYGQVVDVSRLVAPTSSSATQVQGTVAAGAAAAQNPVQMGAKAVSTLPAVVDANDVVKVHADLIGRTLFTESAPSGDWVTEHTTAAAGVNTTTPANLIATDSGAGLKWYLKNVMVTNAATAIGTLVTIEDDETTPTVLWKGYAVYGGGGFAVAFSGVGIATAANAHIHLTCASTGAAIHGSANAYKAP